MQAYLGSPTTTEKGGGITMTNVNTVKKSTVKITVEEFLQKLELDTNSNITSIEVRDGVDGFGVNNVIIFTTESEEEVFA